jgi:PKD repeat protein
MHPLPRGRYTVTVVATNSAGERSRTHTAVVTVVRRG